MSKNTPTTKHDPAPAVPSALQRRIRYGLNVGLAVAAAIGVALLINYLTYTQYRGLSADARRWVRYDLTSTRSYTLSQQTRDVLNTLTQQHRIVSMLGGPDEDPSRTQRVHDLVDEYARTSKLVEAEHLDITRDIDRRKDLLAEFAGLFADDTASIRDALDHGFDDLEDADKNFTQIQQSLQKVIDAGVLTQRRDLDALYELNSKYLLLAEQADAIREARTNQLGEQWKPRLTTDVTSPATDGQDLPDYTLLLAKLQQYFITNIYNELLPTTETVSRVLMGRITTTGADSPERREQILGAKNELAKISQSLAPAQNAGSGLRQKLYDDTIRPLLSVTLPARYDDARVILSEQPCVVVQTPTQARVIPAGRLFRGQAGDTIDPTGQSQEQFLGEEQLTGAMISLTLDPPPLVVFVRSNLPRPALNYEQGEEYIPGEFGSSAARLRSMGFAVTEWAVQKDPPRPLPGQKVVWVTMPYAKPDPGREMRTEQMLKTRVFEFVQQRMDQGDSALVMLSFNPYTDPARAESISNVQGLNDVGLANDPQVALLKQWGINARLYQNVFYLLNEDDEGRATRFSPSFMVADWPQGSMVRESLTGIDTFFKQAHPLELEETAGVEHQKLVVLSEPGMFVQDVPPIERPGQPIQYKPENGRDQVLIGVAAKRGNARLITIGDAHWARDEVTTYGRLPDGREGSGLANQPGATIAYPGNSDLFVSSIYWLAGQDQLIAASPRTQDVRRIAQVRPATLKTYRYLLLAGMPGLIFAAGIAVWLVRRRA